MKTSLTKLKSNLFFLSLALALPVFGKPVAQVKSVSGQVFVVTPEGKTNSVRLNDHLEEKSEIMVGEGSSISLNDYYDATYNLISGSHLKFFDRSVLLKKGKAWIQSTNSRHSLSLTTANGHVDFWKGEFISTFDQASSRSQFLVVNGEVEVSNVLEKNLKYTVSAGTFTLVDPEVESGVPRAPTKVGLTSMNNAVAEFKGMPERVEAPVVSRTIASVQEEKAPVKKGEIIYLSSSRAPASVGLAQHYWKKKIQPEQTISHAPIKFYGIPAAPTPVEVEQPRKPASLKPLSIPAVPKKVGSQLNMDDEFDQTLRKEQAQQPKYSKELESLIQDLKSY
jgi:hypothetical protein